MLNPQEVLWLNKNPNNNGTRPISKHSNASFGDNSENSASTKNIASPWMIK